jgi:hypothetical protein
MFWIRESGPCSNTAYTGVAWPSSARVVRCLVKSFNERNPLSYLLTGYAEDYKKTAYVSRRKERMRSGHHGPYRLGYTGATMGGTKSRNVVTRSQSQKPLSVRIEACNSAS